MRLYKNTTQSSNKYDKDLPEKIRVVIASAGSLTFYKNKCLVQSLTARRILRRRGISSKISFGFMKDQSGKSIAHAWLTVGEFEIVPRGSGYIEIQSF